ncbi:myosin heavy chain-like protein [Thalictrum thalictroides]|uniref:Myosin heavy chain-like protein n=1 Tax=Thalictrum thalictroides TaxID=46969 RepID=A0A7J6VHC2_THATH|nr:myosin heavy chain-like protein [Thalictrum thalictroides]
MNHDRSFSSPELIPHGSQSEHSNDSTLEGVSTNIKLLLKIIQDHNNASPRDDDGRRMQRVAGMLNILDDVKHRIQKSQSFGKKKEIEFRRCYTDLKPNRIPKDKKPPEPLDEKQKLLKELNDSLAARKCLEKMFSSLGKEKAIMSAELAKKAQELNSLEEQLNDLREQNVMLMKKVQTCASKHKDIKNVSDDSQGNATLQERNKALSEQLLKSLDGYRSAKRKLKEAQEENATFRAKMGEMAEEIVAGLNHIHAFQQQISEKNEDVDMEEELSALEHMLQGMKTKIFSDEPKE